MKSTNVINHFGVLSVVFCSFLSTWRELSCSSTVPPGVCVFRLPVAFGVHTAHTIHIEDDDTNEIRIGNDVLFCFSCLLGYSRISVLNFFIMYFSLVSSWQLVYCVSPPIFALSTIWDSTRGLSNFMQRSSETLWSAAVAVVIRRRNTHFQIGR